MIPTLLLPEFLDRSSCARMVDLLKTASETPATVYGTGPAETVRDGVRRVARVAVPADVHDAVLRRLEIARPEIGNHFGLKLSECEEPQFLHYRTGDFFVAHQDGNTPLIRDHTRYRRVSIVVFLNDPGSYGGGELLFHGAWPDWSARHPARAAIGALIAFPSETTHEVTPLTHGERYTIASWYR